MNPRTRFSLLGVLGRLLGFAPACTQGNPRERYTQAGAEAYQQGNYAEAEKQCLAALQEAEEFGPEDPRLATILNNLALVYREQGKYAEAEPLYQHSLTILEKVLGPEHPYVAGSLENYAALLREMGRGDVVANMEARAQAIRAKHAQDNPQE